MEALVGLLLAVVVGYGVLRFLRSRAKAQAEARSRAEKLAKVAREDAKALQRAIDGRR